MKKKERRLECKRILAEWKQSDPQSYKTRLLFLISIGISLLALALNTLGLILKLLQ